MALFESGNPTLSQKIFSRSSAELSGEVMTVRGAINKFGFLMFMVIGGAAYTWHLYAQGSVQLMHTLMYVGLFGGLVCGFTIVFKPMWSPYLAPVYGLLEGLMLGALSAILDASFPGIPIQAAGLTFGIAIAMFLLYNFRIIKATEKFRSIVSTAIAGIAIFYLIDILLFYVFHIDIPITSWNNFSAVSIGFSFIVIALAALKLILDFDLIEKGAEMGAPKYMEWYGAFGLLVTIVWMYIEILKLLSRFANRK